MPRVRWGVGASDIDDFDRSKQFVPYSGPTPPNGVYLWKIKVLQSVAGTREKLPQLRIGLELVPREGEASEGRYEGYFVMTFRSIGDRNQFAYVPFCDAIGVTGAEFVERTITDEDGNIKKIGRWRNDGNQFVLAQLIDRDDNKGGTRKDIGHIGAADEEYAKADEDGADEYYDGDEEPF